MKCICIITDERKKNNTAELQMSKYIIIQFDRVDLQVSKSVFSKFYISYYKRVINSYIQTK